MYRTLLPFSWFSAALILPVMVACSGTETPGGDPGMGGSATSGVSGSGTAGTATTGGTTAGGGTTSGGAQGTAGGGASTAGAGVAGSFVGGGSGGGPALEPLDCGANGTALEHHGPTSNRLNYVIVGDGYSEQDLMAGGTLDQHLQAMLTKRFSDPVGQPYLRYRKFINICVLRYPSSPICGSSEFGCCGDDSSHTTAPAACTSRQRRAGRRGPRAGGCSGSARRWSTARC